MAKSSRLAKWSRQHPLTQPWRLPLAALSSSPPTMPFWPATGWQPLMPGHALTFKKPANHSGDGPDTYFLVAAAVATACNTSAKRLGIKSEVIHPIKPPLGGFLFVAVSC
jgi:hypothetical protein